jgi:UDP-glucose 4-epimerase
LPYYIVIIDAQPLPVVLTRYDRIVFYQGDCGNHTLWQKITETYRCEAVIHLAAFIEVAESVRDPSRYYHNNIRTFITMLDAVLVARIPLVIAASSSSVYGDPRVIPIPENHERRPLSPYARTKVMLEDILVDYHAAYGLKVGILRFANVAGALPEVGLGECHDPESHLIPRIFQALHTNTEFYIQGTDYPTQDGTCLRDFVHVYDVAHMHRLLLQYLMAHHNTDPIILNVGSGKGVSVREVLQSVQAVTRLSVQSKEIPRRPGDTPAIILDTREAMQLLNWKPERSDLAAIVHDAYTFYRGRI